MDRKQNFLKVVSQARNRPLPQGIAIAASYKKDFQKKVFRYHSSTA